MTAAIFSLSWQNIDDRVLAAQKRVFDHFGIRLLQHRIHGFQHGEWMDWVLNQYATVEQFLFVDADAFPLNALAVHEAFERARDGYLYGNAQVSTHIDPRRMFVGPSWCSISRKSWLASGRPSARIDRYHDVAQRWAEWMPPFGVKVEMLMPTKCVKPMWKLPGDLDYGIGTTYESTSGARTFHLFGVGGTTYQDAQCPPETRLNILEETVSNVCTGRAVE
jgi:hypothetical protein